MTLASSPTRSPGLGRDTTTAPGRSPWRRLWLGVPAALLAAVLASGCNRGPTQARKRPVVEVVATTPITAPVADYQDFTGRLSAVKTVDIRARVSGYVLAAPFKEGDIVHEGDLLFQIDPRPYKATYDSAKAQLAAAKAQINVNEANLKLAQATYARARRSGEAASPLEREQDLAQQNVSEANVKLSQAQLGTAQASVETAKLNLDWTTVRAPLTGRISRRLVDPGNLVTQDTTLLTTIVTEDPLYAYFDVDERTYLDLTGLPLSADASWFAGLHFPVLMRLANENDFTHMGTVDFVDNQVTATTGTVRMRGVFRLADFDRDELMKEMKKAQVPAGAVKGRKGPPKLKPGLFVRIRLPIGNPYRATLVPGEALQSDQGRKFLYVLTNKDEVQYRPVELGQSLEGWQAIKKGLAPGERVIVRGTQRVRPGITVKAKPMQDPPRPPHSSLAKMLEDFNHPGHEALGIRH